MLATERDEVPNAPIARAVEEAIQRGELESFGALALELGFKHHGHEHGDATRIRRMLGLVKSWGGRREGLGAYPPKCTTSMKYRNAVEIVRAIGRDPVDFDL